jgi:hypothetical protein
MSNAKKIRRPNIHAQRVALAERYFAEHPADLVFTREVTPAEQRMFNFPPGTACRVVKTPFGFAHAYAPLRAGQN